MGGFIDINTSRRTNFDECRYWKRDDKNKSLEEITHEKNYGFFYARESERMYQSNGTVDNFMFDRNTIMIYTEDFVEISTNDIVEFDGNIWIVVDIQKKEFHKTRQFLKDKTERTYLRLRR